MENSYNTENVSNNPYTNYYTPIQLILPLDVSIIINSSDPVYKFDEVMRGVNLKKYLVSDDSKDSRGRKGYNPVSLLKVILFGFLLKGYVSTRELADLCVNDIRFRWLLRFDKTFPSHMTISNFINKYLKQNIEDIFKEITGYIIKKDNVDMSHLYIDGTKLEANANKYTWVWKKACITNRDKLFVKMTEQLKEVNKDLSFQNIQIGEREVYEIEYVRQIIETIKNTYSLDPKNFAHGKGARKTQGQRFYEFFDTALGRLITYADKLEIIGENRGSYSKTDKDATFMRIKTDYMGNDQLLPAYNIQFGVCDQYITVLDVNQYASDQDCFIPLMNKFKSLYKTLPEYTIADAGYGSLRNYDYCEANGIKKYMKFTMFDKEIKDAKYHNNPFRPVNFKVNEKGNLVCPNNQEFIKIKESKIKDNDYGRTMEVHQCVNCEGCPLRSKCHKSKDNRKINLNKTLTAYHEEVMNNLCSIHGALLLMNRSIMSEGAFGVMKQDRYYKRIYRRGLESVTMELYLVAIGHNLYKYKNKNR